ncbi:MAG: hypothetical protein U9N14_00350 [Pseudomonadota bacterium]|nr:hypothetical protein [Pseudomonadota bacterium]
MERLIHEQSHPSQELQSSGIRPQDNTKLEGLYKSGDMLVTQCEPHGFRRITYFIDRPDILTCFTTTVEALEKDYPVLLSNGDPGVVERLSNGRHRVTWTDDIPKASLIRQTRPGGSN